jgi:hypothetical protein
LAAADRYDEMVESLAKLRTALTTAGLEMDGLAAIPVQADRKADIAADKFKTEMEEVLQAHADEQTNMAVEHERHREAMEHEHKQQLNNVVTIFQDQVTELRAQIAVANGDKAETLAAAKVLATSKGELAALRVELAASKEAVQDLRTSATQQREVAVAAAKAKAEAKAKVAKADAKAMEEEHRRQLDSVVAGFQDQIAVLVAQMVGTSDETDRALSEAVEYRRQAVLYLQRQQEAFDRLREEDTAHIERLLAEAESEANTAEMVVPLLRRQLKEIEAAAAVSLRATAADAAMVEMDALARLQAAERRQLADTEAIAALRGELAASQQKESQKSSAEAALLGHLRAVQAKLQVVRTSSPSDPIPEDPRSPPQPPPPVPEGAATSLPLTPEPVELDPVTPEQSTPAPATEKVERLRLDTVRRRQRTWIRALDQRRLTRGQVRAFERWVAWVRLRADRRSRWNSGAILLRRAQIQTSLAEFCGSSPRVNITQEQTRLSKKSPPSAAANSNNNDVGRTPPPRSARREL